MAIGFPRDLTRDYKNGIYNIQLDMSGWDKATIQVVAPVAAPIYVYGSNDGNALQGVREGNAELAINFSAVQVTNLATGVAANSFSTAGNYKIDINARFLKIAGGGADVYRMLLFNSKID